LKYFGTIDLVSDGRKWKITCEPHVSITLKRLFRGVNERQFGDILITNTPSNCRELEWFLLRYPMEGDTKTLTQGADAQRKVERAVTSLLDGTYVAPEFDLAIPLREYQKIPPAMVFQTGGLLVADELGVGKTAMGIGMFCDPRSLPALVVTPTHLPRQWKEEINRFAPKLRVEIAKTGSSTIKTKSGAVLPMFATFPDVLVMNYHKLSGWAEALNGVIKSVVFDEAHHLRRSDSLKYAAAKHIAHAATFRMGLTGTPIFNYGSEIYPVLNALCPGSLGTHEEFIREWCGGRVDEKGRAKIRDPKAFGTFARDAGLMIRRTRADVGRELPPLTKVTHYVDADLSAIERIGDAAAELARVILRQGESRRGEKMMASEEFNNALRQATGIAKAVFVADFVRMLVESGERVVLFGWHRAVYEIWLDKLKDLSPAMYTGSESVPQKAAAIQAFKSGESPLLIMSLRSGEGVDGLQSVCRTVVIGELDWSGAVHDQNIGRVFRDGQADPVTAYFLISDFGADPTMVDILGLKRQQLEGIRDPYASAVEQMPDVSGHVRRLAEDFLKSRGLKVPDMGPNDERASDLFPVEATD
jgi:SNF2 family DNA or RNA helicase